MASRIVRKVKREKKDIAAKENLPSIVVTPPEKDMKVRIKKPDDEKQITIQTEMVTENKMADFSVNRLIAELSENSKVPKGEIEHIQRRLLQQANEILKVNAFANQPVAEPRIIDTTQKYTNKPGYGRLPLVVPRNKTNQNETLISNEIYQPKQGVSNGYRAEIYQSNLAGEIARRGNIARSAADNQLGDTQLVPEKLQDMSQDGGGMINAGNMQRVGVVEGRGAFFYETGSAVARLAGSARAATARGECLFRLKLKIQRTAIDAIFFLCVLPFRRVIDLIRDVECVQVRGKVKSFESMTRLL